MVYEIMRRIDRDEYVFDPVESETDTGHSGSSVTPNPFSKDKALKAMERVDWEALEMKALEITKKHGDFAVGIRQGCRIINWDVKSYQTGDYTYDIEDRPPTIFITSP